MVTKYGSHHHIVTSTSVDERLFPSPRRHHVAQGLDGGGHEPSHAQDHVLLSHAQNCPDLYRTSTDLHSERAEDPNVRM